MYVQCQHRAVTTPGSSLNRLRVGVLGIRDVAWLVGETPAWLERDFLVLAANFSDGVVPAVVPGNARFAIHNRPCAMVRTNCLLCLPISFKSNKEMRACSVADFPFAQIVITPELWLV